MADKRGCWTRIRPAVALVLLLACDLVLFVLWMSPALVTILAYFTLGCALLPMFVLPTIVIYAHPIALGVAVRRLELLPAPLIWLIGLSATAGLAVAPGLWDRLGERRAIARVGASAPLGSPPRDAPRELTLVLSDISKVGRQQASHACTDTCAALLFGDEVDALGVDVPGVGRTVYRRLDADPCPPWEGGYRPPGLDAFGRSGKCLVAEPGGTLTGPWLAWTVQSHPLPRDFPYGPKAEVRVAEGRGTPGEPSWRLVYMDAYRLWIPFTLAPQSVNATHAGIQGVRSVHREEMDLVALLREAMGYRVEAPDPPAASPYDIVRHHLDTVGEISDEQQKALERALRELRDEPPDHELLAALLEDPRVRPSVLGGLTGYAQHHPEAILPHLERLLTIAENEAHPPVQRKGPAFVIARLPLDALAAHADRIVALAVPDPDEKYAAVSGRFLPIVGRLGVDPSPALAPGLASEHEQVLIAAAKGLCNADLAWAAPHLDAAESAWTAEHGTGALGALGRALVRHGRPEAIAPRLPSLTPSMRSTVESRLEDTVDDPPGGCG